MHVNLAPLRASLDRVYLNSQFVTTNLFIILQHFLKEKIAIIQLLLYYGQMGHGLKVILILINVRYRGPPIDNVEWKWLKYNKHNIIGSKFVI